MFEHPEGACDCDPAVVLAERPVQNVALTPEKLAARIDTALECADRVLFTVTPREELDASERWQRLQDEAWCGQLRHVVAATARMSPSDRDFAGDELGLALGLSTTTGRAMVWEFGEIAALPGLVEAVEGGRLSVRHVKAFMRVLGEVSLTLEQRQAVALVAVAEYAGETPGEWALRIRKLILKIDPAAAERRKQERTAERRVEFYPCADEQGAMWLTGPVEKLARVQARLAAEADRAKKQGDDRTVEQLMCDLALGLLSDGILQGEVPAAYDVAVVTPLSALEGSDEVGEIVGWGPISAGTARDLARQAGSFTQVTVDDRGQVVSVNDPVPADKVRGQDEQTPEDAPSQQLEDEVAPTGPAPRAKAMLRAPCPTTLDPFLARASEAMRDDPVIRELSTDSYRPGRRLARYVETRDRTCVFPGCRRPAARSDKDHRCPWPGGRTSAENLQCLCRHHHRAKQAVFTVVRERDGTLAWITRGGWVFHRPPKGYL